MSHVVMKKTLAKALMDAGVENMDLGGFFQNAFSGIQNNYQAGEPRIGTQEYQPRIQALQGQQQDVYGQQQQLANALLAQSQGQGPNPVLAQLQNATGQNVQQQAALMASQRGASANPALIARLAAQQGAGIQQNAVGQAAALEAQQQLAAQNALAQQQAQMAGQALQGENIAQSGIASQNATITQGQLGAQNINAQTAGQNARTNQGLLGGVLNAAGSILGGLFNEGGEVGKYAGGGLVPLQGLQPYATANPNMPNLGLDDGSQPFQNIGKFDISKPVPSNLGGGAAGGANVSRPSVGPNVMGLPMASSGGMLDATDGGKVAGKAKVKGNSPKNDTEPALLSPGEIVIPRSIAQHPDAVNLAAEFVKHIKLGKKPEDIENFFCGGMKGYADGGPAGRFGRQALANPQTSQPVIPMQEDIQPASFQTTPQIAQPSVQTGGEMTSQQPQDVMSGFPTTSTLSGLENKMSDAYQAEAQAKMAQNKAQADVLEQQQVEMQKAQDTFNGSMQNYQAQHEQLVNDIASGKEDPDKYWNSKGTGGKISTVIGFLLSGLGSGLTGKENMAVAQFNKFRDADIEAQKADLGRKNNLLSDNLKKQGNLQDAYTATRLQMNAMFQGKLALAAAKTGNPVLQAQADLLKGSLLHEDLKLRSELAQNDVLKNMTADSTVSPEMKIQLKFRSDPATKHLALKELGDLKNIQSQMGQLDRVLDDLEKIQTVSNRVTSPVQSSIAIDQAVARLFPIVKTLAGEKMSEGDVQNMVKPMVTNLFSSKKTRQETRANTKEALTAMIPGRIPTLTTYGIVDPKIFTPQSNANMPRPGESRNGYIFTGGNPADKSNWKKQ